MQKKVCVIGSGFSSLASSCFLAQKGYDVIVLEKNNHVGGRANQLKREGFTFDMGPTFYWMPDVFEDFFRAFGHKPSDFYKLNKLNPAYKVFFENNESINIADNLNDIIATFERIEQGSGKKLKGFIENAQSNYDIAIKDLVYKPGENLFEIITPETVKKLGLFFTSIKKQVANVVVNPHLRKILEFPVLFLGAKSVDTPAFYNFMNYADFQLGTWHPEGGMYEVVKAMEFLAKELGVTFKTNTNVEGLEVTKGTVSGVITNTGRVECDIVLSGADYAHAEKLLPKEYKQYSDAYWESRKFAPSSLLFYVGFDTRLKNIAHHSLFFDADFSKHEKAIYDTKTWPEEPLFYGSFPSVTDATVAPEGKECGIFLIPIAPGLEDTPQLRQKYFDIVIQRLEKNIQQEVKKDILFYESFGVNDFISQYNSYKGNAYGLANTLLQTHILRPKLKSKKVDNLYFCGQLTVPGPGVPPSLISGKIVSDLIYKYHRSEGNI
ncbi:phytoene desaturase family protein [Flavobacterium rhizosphaerae]|uniref:Phytoene desaturase family protein n=1 Tax=Flavobacterium rhizosphaerae TaxID=3163298 RepID=A0ABW8YZG3_9FLAO